MLVSILHINFILLDSVELILQLSIVPGFTSDKPKIEPFAYTSFRSSGRNTLGYENNAYGTNFIYPVVPDKLNLILAVERNKLKLDENHDITKKSFLAGIGTNDFTKIDEWKVSSYAVAGWSWHDSSRDVLTNIVSTGIADVSADYESAEVITGVNFTRILNQRVNESVTNEQESELAKTFSFSRFLEGHLQKPLFFQCF